MTDKKVDITEEQVDELIEKAEALAGWHEVNVIQAIAEGTKDKWELMLKDMGNGKVKNNNYNKGYMKALLDLYYSLKIMLENITEENTKEETQTEGETNE